MIIWMKMSRIDCFILVIHFVLHLGLIYERVMSMLYYNLIRVLTNPPLSNTKIEIVYQSHADIWKKTQRQNIIVNGIKETASLHIPT